MKARSGLGWRRTLLTLGCRSLTHPSRLPPSLMSTWHRVSVGTVVLIFFLSETAFSPDNSTTPWLAGLRLDSFPGPTLAHQVAQAAHSIGADILSPAASSFETPVPDPDMEGYASFTTKEMIDAAHQLGLKVKPWTVNRMNIVEQLLDWNADGIISDCTSRCRPPRAVSGVLTRRSSAAADPNVVRRLAKHRGLPVAPKYPKQRVLSCLQRHLFKQLAPLQAESPALLRW